MFVLCFEPNGDCWDATLFIEVGFGDMVPSRSFLGYEESLFGKMQVLHCVINCMYQMRTTILDPHMLTDAGLRHLLRHGPCSPGNVHVSHPGPICLASTQMKSISLLTHCI